MHVAPPLSRMTMQTHVILSPDASGPLLRLARAHACVCADGAKKCFSPIPAGTAPFRSLFSRRLTRKSRRGFYYGSYRQTRKRKKNVNPSGSLTRRARRYQLARHRINWFISQRCRGLCANLRCHLPHDPIHRSRSSFTGDRKRGRVR